ncbi:hypothetical protein [Thermoanaerobacter mathranii]|uniref:hypothetical protein n=1 Tax=Thermoanaerobacter mathranii TaxID=583357 RepID=UPI0005A1E319|nr:hypothetical protein [Thermoanaerobacter mathranii]
MKKLHNKLKEALKIYQEAKLSYSEVIFFPEKIYKRFYVTYYISVGVFAFSSIQIVNAYSIHRKFGSLEVLFLILTILYLVSSSYIEKIIKSFSKLQIRNNIDLYITNLTTELIKPNLSKIIRESTVNKESFQLKLNNSVLTSLTNGLLQIISFLAGFFAKALYESFKNGADCDNVFRSLVTLVLLYFILLLVTHLLLDMFKSKNLYYIEMYDYQIKYAEYLKTQIKL